MDGRDELDGAATAATMRQDTTSAIAPKIANRRGERLQELHAAALDVLDPLRASIRSAIADLLEIGSQMGAAIKADLSAGKIELREIGDALPAISSLTLVHRQVTRYVQLDEDWTSEQHSDRDGKRRRRLATVPLENRKADT